MERKDLFHHCFEASAIGEGDLMPVGGGTIGSTHMPWKVRADFENIYPRFAAIAENTEKQLRTPEWENYFTQACPSIPADLAITLQTFTQAYEGKRKIQDTNKTARNALYENASDNCVALSEVFNNNKAMCVEVSLLAKKYLDEKGIQSRVFSGEFMPGLDKDGIHDTAAHTFLIITHEGQDYIYDPTRPTVMQGHAMFSLSRPCADLKDIEQRMKEDCLMVAADNVLDGSREYYGVGDGGNVPDNLVIRTPASGLR